ncbi:hypothetical protein GOP47_0020669 [Adiantum capillus-veneris]|uniref:Uncharacterized protein n=1 Tax=Adiantum capillus-veneris TaxID=13818 RepID=A0A9D4Z768_ADICA|nr:hypothetical protein GOP47_0020669 [Adiantum capillus-veneris]
MHLGFLLQFVSTRQRCVRLATKITRRTRATGKEVRLVHLHGWKESIPCGTLPICLLSLSISLYVLPAS